jgi:AraC-like DNA-binding protein
MRLRLGFAWRMIVDGFSLTRATYDAGFADQSHLTRRFAAAFGLPPARYARMLAVPPGARSDAVDVGVAASGRAFAPRASA